MAPFYIYDRNSYTNKMAYLCWNGPLDSIIFHPTSAYTQNNEDTQATNYRGSAWQNQLTCGFIVYLYGKESPKCEVHPYV